MQRLGRIDSSADPVRLAHMFVAAYQGACSSLRSLTTSRRCGTRCTPPLDHLRTFATTPDDADAS